MKYARAWQNYEEVAAYLFSEIADEFGLGCVEGKQLRVGRRTGANWEIDMIGFRSESDSIVLIECKQFSRRRVSQGIVADLAYRITDTGAEGGIIVSPLGLQKGASHVANAEKIISVQLNFGASITQYILRFLNKIKVGIQPEGTTVCAGILDGSLEISNNAQT